MSENTLQINKPKNQNVISNDYGFNFEKKTSDFVKYNKIAKSDSGVGDTFRFFPKFTTCPVIQQMNPLKLNISEIVLNCT